MNMVELPKSLRGMEGDNIRDLTLVFAVLSSQFDTIQKTQEQMGVRLEKISEDVKANYVTKEAIQPLRSGVGRVVEQVIAFVVGAILTYVFVKK